MPPTAWLGVDPEHPEPARIAEAAAVLRRGALVAFPTETVYGLGANALDPVAVRRIFEAKGRPAHDPLIVHLAGAEALAEAVAAVPPAVPELAARFWPGPLTLVLPKSGAVPGIVTAGGETVAVRVPAHPVALALIRAAGVPVAAPSANRFGHVSPTRAEHVRADLDGRIAMILDGGPTPVGVESTVLSLVTPEPTILRPGGVSRESLEAVLGPVAVLARALSPGEEPIPSPGTLLQHYAPRAPLTLYRGARRPALAAMRAEAQRLLDEGARVGVLVAQEDAATFDGLALEVLALGAEGELAQMARRLFACMRALDQRGVTVILARDVGTAGLGLAIRDRLTRAAGRVIDV